MCVCPDTRTTPVISTPPSILFVDLDLAPGETKKCMCFFLYISLFSALVPPASFLCNSFLFLVSYKLKLPNDIPPSHRGKAIRFTYSLVVGTQRANTTPSGGQGQVVQIPFRVLNHVSGKLIQSWYSMNSLTHFSMLP